MIEKPGRSDISSRRRRILRIMATAGALAVSRTGLSSLPSPEVFRWRGTALGASASLALYGIDEIGGRRIVEQVTAEVRRLEMVFSLYLAESSLSRLNSRGTLIDPPIDLLRLLSQARAVSEATDGAFDVTVQPLWDLYAKHFMDGSMKSSGPGAEALELARSVTGYKMISIDSGFINLQKAGMALTLNGIAQGYITDRVADLLYADGLRNVLIDLGEIRALNSHPSGRPWVVGIQDSENPKQTGLEINISHQAVATSAGSGTRFDKSGINHHLINPHSGQVSNEYMSLSVVGRHAALTDALSTGLYNMKPDLAHIALAKFPGYTAYVVFNDGNKQTWGG